MLTLKLLVLSYAILQQFYVESFTSTSSSSLLSFASSSTKIISKFGIHGENQPKLKHNRMYPRHYSLNMESEKLPANNSKNLLADNSKLDITNENERAILFFMGEIASLTNMIAMPNYSSVQYTLDDKCRVINQELKLNTNSNAVSNEDINEGRYYCMGNNQGPMEHMAFLNQVIVNLSMVVKSHFTKKNLSMEWNELSVERSPSNKLDTTIVKLLNKSSDTNTVVLEVPLRTSYIGRNDSWLAQVESVTKPHFENGSLYTIVRGYSRFQLEQDANGQTDSISFIGSPTPDMPDQINLPVTLVATWSGSKLIWGWNREELLGVDAESEVFSPLTMEHVHVFKDKDGDDTTATSNDPLRACTLTNNLFCTQNEAWAFCANALAGANSNDFTDLYMANVGSGTWFFTFKKSHFEDLKKYLKEKQ